MQEDDKQTPNSWQQPATNNTGAPYQAPTPDPDNSTPVGETNSSDLSAQNTPEISDQISETIDSSVQAESDAALLRWQAKEHIDHHRSMGWYIALGAISVTLILLAIFLMDSWTFALLIPVMAVALVVYTQRPPALVNYTLSRKGLYVNERLYTYDSFRAFSVVSHAGHHSASLIPRKRFQLSQTVYFPEEVGEPLVDMLAARMPMQDARPDVFDRIITRLRM